ncbi:DUF4338 domain-containing protein [bacterium]|nr:DUF4338 domain-containing protein [bacterium]
MRYCGREFSEEEVTWINEQVVGHPDWSRRKLSETFCARFSWYKPDGGLKAMSCRVAFLRMERDGVICLPTPKGKPAGPPRVKTQVSLLTEPGHALTRPAGQLDIEFEVVTKRSSRLWNEYIERYHYLGYTTLPGAQLRYFVLVDGEIVALLGFSAAAWKTAPRDDMIGWTPEERERNLRYVVNNSRFLVLPWIQVRNLCSRILSSVCRRLPDDWEQQYGYRPVLVETFVQKDRFSGACYKASNWQYVGDTTGRGKLSRSSKATKPIKGVYLFPLSRRFQEVVCA